MNDIDLPVPFGYTSRWQGPDAYHVRQPIPADVSNVRVGIIGLGGIALAKHLPAIQRLRTASEPVQVVAGADIDPQTGERAASLYGFRFYTDYRKMLDSEDLDAIMVLIRPEPPRGVVISTCLKMSLPVFTEKPLLDQGESHLEATLTEAHALCELAKAKDLPFMVGFGKRYTPPYADAQAIIASGTIGKPAMLAAKMCLGWGGEKFLEQSACHMVDLCRFFMGDVSSLTAYGVNYYRKSAYPFDNACVIMKFQNGSVGTLYLSSSSLSLKPWERIEIYGEKAWIAIEDSVSLTLYDSETGPAKTWNPVWPNTLLFEAEFSGFAWEIKSFLDAVRYHHPASPSGWDGYRGIELCYAIHRSIKTGQEVHLPIT